MDANSRTSSPLSPTSRCSLSPTSNRESITSTSIGAENQVRWRLENQLKQAMPTGKPSTGWHPALVQLVVDRAKDLDVRSTDIVHAKSLLAHAGYKKVRYRGMISPDHSGGPQGCTAWRRNPQFVIDIPAEAMSAPAAERAIHLGLSGLDGETLDNFRIALMHNQPGSTFDRALPSASTAEAGEWSKTASTVDFTPTGGITRFYVVIETLCERMWGEFALVLLSQNESFVKLSPVPSEDVHFSCFQCTWSVPDGTAGGNALQPSFLSNPQFRLQLTQPTNVCILCTQEEGTSNYAEAPWCVRSCYTTEKLGLHVFVNHGSEYFNCHASVNPSMHQRSCLSELPKYVRKQEVALELCLDPDDSSPYFIIPSIDKPDTEGSFTITVLSDHRIGLDRASAWYTPSQLRVHSELTRSTSVLVDKTQEETAIEAKSPKSRGRKKSAPLYRRDLQIFPG